MHEACLEGHAGIVELMLSFGADVDAPGGDGDTPLHDAIGNGHYQVVELLLQYGASIDAFNENKQTPLEFALEKEKDALSLVSKLTFMPLFIFMQSMNFMNCNLLFYAERELKSDHMYLFKVYFLYCC